MRKYYIEVDDKGNEVERKLTTFNELEDLESMDLDELAEVYYTATAELYSKARKVVLIESLLKKLHEEVPSEDWEAKASIMHEATDNIILTQEAL